MKIINTTRRVLMVFISCLSCVSWFGVGTASAAEDEPRICSAIRPATEFRLVGVAGRFWRKNELKVRFLDGDDHVQAQVIRYAKVWSEHANVRFDFGDHEDAEIRISFKGKGSWSAIGTDALNVAKTKPTMNFGWFGKHTSAEEFRRTTLHEFGHALGFDHEHKSPKGGIQWNKKAAYEHFQKTNGWDNDEVDRNVFDTYSTSRTNYSELDSRSIMFYAVPASLTLDGFSAAWNSDLSATDKRFIARIYPKGAREVDPNEVRDYAVVTFNNDTGGTFKYLFRWNEADRWVSTTIQRGERWLHHRELSGREELSPEVRFDLDLSEEISLDRLPVKFAKVRRAGEPIDSDGRRYRFHAVEVRTPQGVKQYLRLDDVPSKK